MQTRNKLRLATSAVTALAFTGSLAFAESGTPAATKTPAATEAPATATPDKQAITPARYPSVVGLPVISSDGKTVGQVLSVGPGKESKSMALAVKPAEDLGSKASEVYIPLDRSVIEGRTVQLIVSMDDVKKFYVR